MTSSKIRTTFALVTVTATVMTVALSAAPAGAALGPVRARLVLETFNGVHYGACAVTVRGSVVITQVPNVQAEAQRLIDSHHKVVVRVWDDDPFSDDLLLGPYTLGPRPPWGPSGHIAPAPYGLWFTVRDSPVGGRDELNGDDDNPDWNEELYAGVRLIKDSTPADIGADGPTIRSGETNRVTGHDFGRGCGGFPRVPFP